MFTSALDGEARRGSVSHWYLAEAVGEDDAARQIPLTSWPFRIGRRRDATLCLPSHGISKDHAEFTLQGNALSLRNLGSTNGTFVNGSRLEGETRLNPGDVIHFANLEFRLGRHVDANCPATVAEAPSALISAIGQFDRLFDAGAATPFYQPIVRLSDGNRVGYEVLARSNVSGLETPREMFLAGDRLKLSDQLSRLFRRLGVQFAPALQDAPNLFLNTHPIEVYDAVLLDSLCELRALAPSRALTLEVHEAAVTNIPAMREFRAALSDLDIALAYDDFGSGRDRLLDLAEVPPDFLKFDARFVRNIHTASGARRLLLSGLVELVRELGISPLAEAVETLEEHQVCVDVGFEFGQGFFYGRPAPATHFSN